jgi:hypothetical protein
VNCTGADPDKSLTETRGCVTEDRDARSGRQRLGVHRKGLLRVDTGRVHRDGF